MFFLSGLERSCGSHGVMADIWYADCLVYENGPKIKLNLKLIKIVTPDI